MKQFGDSGVIDSGFRRAEDGWHVVKVDEGIGYLMKKSDDGDVISLTKGGEKNWKIPLIVDDENDDSHEVKIDVIIGENAKGEQILSGFIGASGLMEKFEKAFPGEVSVFDEKVMAKVKSNFQGSVFRVKTKQNEYVPKGKTEKQIAVNVIAFGPMTKSVDTLEKEFFGDKKVSKEGKKAEEKVKVEDEKW